MIYDVAFTMFASAMLALYAQDWTPLVLGVCLSCLWCLIATKKK